MSRFSRHERQSAWRWRWWSSCDRCHAGIRNVVVLPIAEIIAGCPTAWTHPGAKGADARPQRRPRLARLLSLFIRPVECHLLDNVRRVHLNDEMDGDGYRRFEKCRERTAFFSGDTTATRTRDGDRKSICRCMECVLSGNMIFLKIFTNAIRTSFRFDQISWF